MHFVKVRIFDKVLFKVRLQFYSRKHFVERQKKKTRISFLSFINLHLIKVSIFDKVLFEMRTVVFLKPNRGGISVSAVHFGFLVQHQKFRLDIGDELIVITLV